MIRFLQKSDFEDYIFLLTQLTVVGEVSKQQFEDFVDSQDENRFTVVYEKDSRIIGCLTILIEQKVARSFGRAMHIEDVVTHPAHRGEGIASALIEHAKTIYKSRNCYKIILNCNKNNIDFYGKFGFVQNGFQMCYMD